ncbi:MAG: hypothetical protein KC423_23265 [Anaerolineales bacterium]|nr:hypothetical protein [Anaerolineales bacterium]MCB9432266.1 hypothetical protein [Ardenticatenaceae bacterium]
MNEVGHIDEGVATVQESTSLKEGTMMTLTYWFLTLPTLLAGAYSMYRLLLWQAEKKKRPLPAPVTIPQRGR